MIPPTPSSWTRILSSAGGAASLLPRALAAAALGGAGLTVLGDGAESSSYSLCDSGAGDDGDGWPSSSGAAPSSRDRAENNATTSSSRAAAVAPRFVARGQAAPSAAIVSAGRMTTLAATATTSSSSRGDVLATSSSCDNGILLLATSDASAERSASLAAAARLSSGEGKRPIAGGDDAQTSSADANGEIDNNSIERSTTSGSKNEQSSSDRSPMFEKDDDDSYPIFTPYHHSLLKKYLTPEVWSKLSKVSTSYGTTIEDIIRAGVALPIGANPPRRVGVLVADAECYILFRELLDPIISEYHGIKCYEEWMDPELPKEQYFKEKMAPFADVARPGGNAGGNAPAIAPANVDEDDAYGVIKSSGADEDSDEDDDTTFLLGEEEDGFVEYVATPQSQSSPPASTSSAAPPTSLPPSSNNGTAARRVAAIASKRKGSFRRHPTIINNPRLVTNREADPDGKYILSTRIRVARNVADVKFPPAMSRADRRHVQRLVDECTGHFHSPALADGTFLPVLSMENDQNLDLIERHILFDNPNEWTIASGLGRDWPDGRALYANVADLRAQTPDFMIWVNEEDHLRIMCLRSGGDIQGVFTTLMNGVRELEREMRKRGWHFAYDSRLGYLTSCPTNVGTTMRASVHVRLTELGRLPGFFELVQRLKLEVRGKYGETDRHYTGVFDISNAERLGKSEVHLINVMVEGVAKLIELERRLEAGEDVDIDEIAQE